MEACYSCDRYRGLEANSIHNGGIQICSRDYVLAGSSILWPLR
jgi:hypothetical protein